MGHFIANKRRAVPRLTELRRVLSEELPRILNGHKFDMCVFYDSAAVYDGNARPERLECNTTACAAGWGALLSPKLRRKGAPRFVKKPWGGWMFALSEAQGGGDLCEFYGLTDRGVDYLFYAVGVGELGSEYRGEAALLAEIAAIDKVLAEAAGGSR